MDARILLTALELDLFTVLGARAWRVPALARRLKVSVRGLEILCRNLVGAGVLRKAGDRYRNGRVAATTEGLQLTWQTADAEALPFDDAAFDAVLSCIGVMFAPHHQLAADELVRVCRPGGTIGVLSWTPEGFIGQLFATMKPYAPPPPPGASPAPLWGRADHVRDLLGHRVSDLVARQQTLRVDRFTTGAEFRDFFKTNYGPTISVYRFIADDPAKVEALDADLAALGDRFLRDGVMDWEYLLVTARRV